MRCGKCLPCLQRYSLEWAHRCWLEHHQHLVSCCVTLTYDNEHLPPNGELRRSDVQKFLKRLRKCYPCRYFGCGEYGSLKTNRPHYHIVLFGVNFADDRRRWFDPKNPFAVMYYSPTLSRLWKNGIATLEDYTFRSAYYSSKYLTKLKPNSEHSVNPFVMMSLRPSIGFASLAYKDIERGYWLKDGEKVYLPRSYIQSLERIGVDVSELKGKRLAVREEVTSEESLRRRKIAESFEENYLDKLHFL